MLPTLVLLDNEYSFLAHQWTQKGDGISRLFEFPESVHLPDHATYQTDEFAARRIKRVLENKKHCIGSIIVTNSRGAGLITTLLCVAPEMRHLIVIISHDEISSNQRILYAKIGVVNFILRAKKKDDNDSISLQEFCSEFSKRSELKDCSPQAVIQRIKSGRTKQKDMTT